MTGEGKVGEILLPLYPRQPDERDALHRRASDPARRIWLHREGLIEGFTKKYGVKRLVYIELLDDPTAAIAREKAMKKWRRAWKIDLIERDNPAWYDLYVRVNW